MQAKCSEILIPVFLFNNSKIIVTFHPLAILKDDIFSDDDGPRHMIINTEWGAFGDKGELDFIRTKWDEAVDAGSLNPGSKIDQRFHYLLQEYSNLN
jgi:hypothetical protein